MCYNKLVITLIRLGNRNNAVKERKLHMLLNSDSRHRRKMKLGMCFANEPGDGGAGGVGGGTGSDDPNNKKPDDKGNENKDAKFTQDDVNKILSERLAEEKAKKDKELADLKAEMERKAELDKMSEQDRTKARLADIEKKYQEELDKNALAIQKDETRKLLEEEKLPASFLNFVLVPKDETKTKLNISELKKVFDEEVKKGVEAKIPSHKPSFNDGKKDNNDNRNSGPLSSLVNLQNSIAEHYQK